ncbi:MAG: hypothetical protein H5T33_01920 [Candidatus Methanosuratus sp.]|nr:hypothetical protein [Candidatus Methanosuratincola sp.]
MKKYKTWASLNAEGQAAWGHVFPDGEVPVQSIIAQAATLEGIAETERVFLVDWRALTEQQQNEVLEKLSKRSSAAKDAILKDILKIGLPLREKYTDGCGTTRMALFL